MIISPLNWHLQSTIAFAVQTFWCSFSYYVRSNVQSIQIKYNSAFERLHFSPELMLGSHQLESYWYSYLKLFNWRGPLCFILTKQTKCNKSDIPHKLDKHPPVSFWWKLCQTYIPHFTFWLLSSLISCGRKGNSPFFLLGKEHTYTYLPIDTGLVTNTL